MVKEISKFNLNVYGYQLEVNVPKEKEQLYLSAAEYANKKIESYMETYVGMPLPHRSVQEILLMAMLDIAVGSIECKQSNENCSFLGKIKYFLKSFALRGHNLCLTLVIC